MVVSLLGTAMRSLPILPAHPDCEGIHFKVTLQLSRLDLSSEAKAYPPGQSTDALKGKQFISCLQKNMEPVAPSRHPLPPAQTFRQGSTSSAPREKRLVESACTLEETPS